MTMFHLRPRPQPLRRSQASLPVYGHVLVLLTTLCLAIVLNWLLDPIVHEDDFILPILLVALVAHYVSGWTAAYAAVLSAGGVVLTQPVPRFEGHVDLLSYSVRICLFLVVSLAICGLAEDRRRAHRAEQRALDGSEQKRQRAAFLSSMAAALTGTAPAKGTRAQTLVDRLVPDWATWSAVITSEAQGDLNVIACQEALAGHCGSLASDAALRLAPAPDAIRTALETGSITVSDLAPSGDGIPSGSVRRLWIVPLRVASATDPGAGSAMALLIGDPDDLLFERDPHSPLLHDLAILAGQSLENAALFDEARQQVTMRERLLSVVSHDLRNPLTSVQLGTEALLRILPSDSEAETSRTIVLQMQRAAHRMMVLIGDLLDLTRFERGGLVLQRRLTTVRQLFAETMETFALQASDKHVTLVTQGTAAVPAIAVDHDRILQALANLMANALAITTAGGRVTLAAAVADERVTLTVHDTGPGIPPDILPHLFDRYWKPVNRTQKGTGLGLSIAKGIVEAHGGRIWANNQAEGGAAFHLVLPLTVPDSVVPDGPTARCEATQEVPGDQRAPARPG